MILVINFDCSLRVIKFAFVNVVNYLDFIQFLVF